ASIATTMRADAAVFEETRMKPSPSGLVLPEQRVVAVDDLSVMFRRERATFDAVRHVSFHVDRGETLAIVGESG
ncbi:hypothetical protein CA830_32200, partial [Burkholderia multivorans]